jgi:hypothetical protein
VRFWIVSERLGLVCSTNDEAYAQDIAIMVAVNTARTVYLHDRTTEEVLCSA